MPLLSWFSVIKIDIIWHLGIGSHRALTIIMKPAVIELLQNH